MFAISSVLLKTIHELQPFQNIQGLALGGGSGDYFIFLNIDLI